MCLCARPVHLVDDAIADNGGGVETGNSRGIGGKLMTATTVSRRIRHREKHCRSRERCVEIQLRAVKNERSTGGDFLRPLDAFRTRTDGQTAELTDDLSCGVSCACRARREIAMLSISL